MALKFEYVARETFSNLRRNVAITIASILTVSVSLALVGAALMLRQGVGHATEKWRGGIEFSIFMNPDATQEQIDAIRNDLEQNPGVVGEKLRFVDQQESFEEYKRLFKDQPELLDEQIVRPELLPPSFRVVPVEKNADLIAELGQQYRVKAGVKTVVFADEVVRLIQNLSGHLTMGMLIMAIVLLAAATMLILTTIQMAMLARRNEIEVMKLVGASNWFIRIPFMVEGLVQGVSGALVAIGGLAIFRPIFEGWLPQPDQISLVSGFILKSNEVFSLYLVLGLTGCVVGAFGAGLAVTRFLDV